METTALALAVAHPDAAAAILAIGQQLAQFGERLGLPPGEHAAAGPDDEEHQEQPVVPPTPIQRPRQRRGLGPGYQGLRIPPDRTASGGAVDRVLTGTPSSPSTRHPPSDPQVMTPCGAARS